MNHQTDTSHSRSTSLEIQFSQIQNSKQPTHDLLLTQTGFSYNIFEIHKHF